MVISAQCCVEPKKKSSPTSRQVTNFIFYKDIYVYKPELAKYSYLNYCIIQLQPMYVYIEIMKYFGFDTDLYNSDMDQLDLIKLM